MPLKSAPYPVDPFAMLNGYSFDENTNARPAVIDGEVVWLPTLAGLLKGESVSSPVPRRGLWTAVTAATSSDAAFERLEQALAEGQDLESAMNLTSTDGAES